MAITQVGFRGRDDVAELNSHVFTHGPDTYWTQRLHPFRVRYSLDGTGTVAGQLEFSTTGTSAWANVTDTSGTVQAARSSMFTEGAATLAVLTDTDSFVGGYADEEDGVTGSV